LQRSQSIRIVLVDNNRMMRDGLKALFQGRPGVEVVGESDEVPEALEVVRASQPDLVVMNIGLGASAGMDVARRLSQEQSDAKIIALSAFGNKAHVAEAFRAGIHAYVAKRNCFAELVQAINAVLSGSTYLCVHTREIVIEDYTGSTKSTQDKSPSSLTDREYEVLRLFAEGKTSKEIALLMDLSSKTIDACRRQLLRKLHVDGTAGLVKHAIVMGLTPVTP
jgi:DNA-binding NarL/FixJ family response regulator